MFFLILSLVTAFARIEFEPLREDATMPANCVNLTTEDFSEQHTRVIYGIRGAIAKGFTHEFDLERQEARDLWHAINGDSAATTVVRASDRLSDLLQILETKGREMGFDYGKEGDILEAFALLDLESKYPNSEYFRTGGYEYSNGTGPVVGELDVLVGRRSDCNIIVVGEAKLGHKMLGKAHKQLNRFANFYKHNAN